MDTKFQTSFIPKKPILSDQDVIKRHSGGTSVFMFIAMIVFVLSLAGAGFTIVWKQVLTKSQDNYRLELRKKEASFNQPLIDQLKKANTKIDLGSQLLKRHLAVAELFDIIGQLTIQGVRFTSFEFASPEATNQSSASSDLKVTMKGVGNNFVSIAYQSDVLGQSERFGKKKPIKNPVLSDLVLDQNGKVAFTFTGYVNPSDILYENTLTTDNNSSTN